jgi:hypothetical protein
MNFYNKITIKISSRNINAKNLNIIWHETLPCAPPQKLHKFCPQGSKFAEPQRSLSLLRLIIGKLCDRVPIEHDIYIIFHLLISLTLTHISHEHTH